MGFLLVIAVIGLVEIRANWTGYRIIKKKMVFLLVINFIFFFSLSCSCANIFPLDHRNPSLIRLVECYKVKKKFLEIWGRDMVLYKRHGPFLCCDVYAIKIPSYLVWMNLILAWVRYEWRETVSALPGLTNSSTVFSC